MTARCTSGPVDWAALEHVGVLGLARVRRAIRDAPPSSLAQTDRAAADLRDRADAVGLYIGDPVALAGVALGIEVVTATVMESARRHGAVDAVQVFGLGGAVLAAVLPHVPPGVLR